MRPVSIFFFSSYIQLLGSRYKDGGQGGGRKERGQKPSKTHLTRLKIYQGEKREGIS
jgi:hypothetical protein